ncbi:MAG: tetratricopeptide repeat protein [Xanthomonadales bacterium]|nr:tetratricopeptide repeat protein [Xanthomonadales bacterium]
MTYRFGPYQLDPGSSCLIGPDGEIALRPMTLSVLRLLLESAPNVVGHEMLLDRVWGRQAVSPGVLSQSIRELRKALGDSPQSPRYIETRHRVGYRFIADIEVLGASEPAGRSTPPATATPRESKSAWRNWPLIGSLVALALAVGLLWHGGSLDNLDAISELRAAEIIHVARPQEPEALAWYREGLAALDRSDLPTAVERLELALKREPESVAAMAALADALARSGHAEEARAWVERAQRDAASLPRSEQLRLEAFAATLNHQHGDAADSLLALFQLDPGDADAGLRLAAAQIRSGHARDAEKTLNQLTELDSPSISPFRLALAHARLASAHGDHRAWRDAAERARKLAESAMENVDAELQLAWAQLRLGSTDAARSTLGSIDQHLEQMQWPAGDIRRDMLAATLLRESGKLDESIARFEQAADKARSHGLRMDRLAAVREAAFVQVMAGDQSGAVERLAPLLEELNTLDAPQELGLTLDVASIAHQQAGNPDQALIMSQRALLAHQRAGDPMGEAAVRSNLAMLYARSGRNEDAHEQFERARAIFAEAGDIRGVATALSNLAILYTRAGRTEAAREANETALEGFRQVGANADIARIQFNLGIQDRRAGNVLMARQRIAEARESFIAIGATDFSMQATATLAGLHMDTGDLAAAGELLNGTVMPDNLSPQRRAALASAAGRLAALQGQLDRAESRFLEARAARQEAGQEGWLLMAELDLARLAAMRGQWPTAAQQARRIRRAFQADDDAPAAFRAGLLLAVSLDAEGRKDDAIDLLHTMESELPPASEPLLDWQADVLRAALQEESRALAQLAERLHQSGHLVLSLHARLLAGQEGDHEARDELLRLGVAPETLLPAPF